MARPNPVETLTPLRPAAFHILLALVDGDRHGYAIKQEVEGRTGGTVRMGPGTLYENIQRMEEVGLIEESDRRPDPAHDKTQRRYYRLTERGRVTLGDEVSRLGEIVDYARSKEMLRGPRHA